MHFRVDHLHYPSILVIVNDLEVTEFGLHTPHTPDFVIDRPHGLPVYLLMCFTTPFFSRTANGIERGVPGDCLIHDLPFPQRHGTPPGQRAGFRNDWIHVRGEGFAPLMEQYGLPFNRLIRTGRTDIFSSLLRDISRERFRREAYWRSAVTHSLEMLLLQVARHWQRDPSVAPTRPDAAMREKFFRLRLAIAAHVEHPWTVSQMARTVSLSASRFSVLYRHFFEVSPMEDLIRHRIDRARELLSHTDRTVGQIAQAAGFCSIYYFSRAFRHRVGRSPRNCR